jgi:hypothetical protein
MRQLIKAPSELNINLSLKNYLIIKLAHSLIKKLGITNIRPVIGFVDFNPKFS